MVTDDNIVNKFKDSVKKVNRDPEFIEYMSEEKDKPIIQNPLISMTREEGINEEKLKTAKNLLHDKVDVNIISKATGLSIEEINKLKD